MKSSYLRFGRLSSCQCNDEGKRQSPLLVMDPSSLLWVTRRKLSLTFTLPQLFVVKENRKVKQEVDRRPICIVCEFGGSYLHKLQVLQK